MEWKIGCSGFAYGEWNEFFYPNDIPTTKWFEFYANHFDTLELNVTFYRFPTLTFLQNLYKRSPGDYCFIVKAPKLITHTQRFIDATEILENFYTIIKKGLKEKLGAVLFQLPPSYKYSEENLEVIINSMDTSFINIVEFRHKTWWAKKVYQQLGKKKITFCGVSYPGLPDEVIVNTANPYYRFHGVPKLYYSMYSTPFLNNIADTFLASKKIENVFLLFNNTATRAALENASYLQQYVEL